MPFDNVPLHVETRPLVLMLQAARSKIEQGWCQGAMRQRGKVCMLGALSDSRCYAEELYHDAEKLLFRAIDSCGYPHAQISSFNDAAGRTKEQVLDIYDAAIVRARSLT